ncbi:MAG: flavodoxin II [Flavobacteriales bacterium]|jgi:flavodoxin II
MNTPQRAPIAIFYGSSTCYTEMAAEKIQSSIGESFVDLHNIADCELSLVQEYSSIIMGIPTWDYGELQEDWENIWDELCTQDLSHATIALFGMGDQIGYPQWFQDALGYLHDQVIICGAKVCGYWPSAAYTFEESKALTEDKQFFMGLALDEENECELSDERIRLWCTDILKEFKLMPL